MSEPGPSAGDLTAAAPDEKADPMTSSHERTETLTFAAITLSFAAAMFALSVTSDRNSTAERERAGQPNTSSATNSAADQAE